MAPLKRALIGWELARVPFNLVLLAFGLWWSAPLKQKMIDDALLGYWGSVLAFGFTANVFYTLGPAAEAYLFAFCNRGFDRWRWLVFSLELVLSVSVTWAFVWSMKILYVVLYHGR